jgi:hypothetical protein
MTPQPPLPPAPSRTGSRQRLVVLCDECCDHDDPGCFGPSDDAGRRPRPGRADTDGRIAQSGGDCAVDGWDDLGPEAA